MSGEVEEAVQGYLTAITLMPRFAAAHSNLGNLILTLPCPLTQIYSYLTSLLHSLPSSLYPYLPPSLPTYLPPFLPVTLHPLFIYSAILSPNFPPSLLTYLLY